MANINAQLIYAKVFWIYIKFPIACNPSTRKFFVWSDKDLFYPFYVAECIVISGFFTNVAEFINIAYSGKFEIVPIVLLFIGVSLITFDVLAAVATTLIKHECAAFMNDLMRHVDELEEGESDFFSRYARLKDGSLAIATRNYF